MIEELVVVLRDGRTLIGRLKSIDQYGKHFVSIFHSFIAMKFILHAM